MVIVEIKSLNVFPNVILYKLDPKEENDKIIHVVYVKQDFKELIVQDFSNDGSCKLSWIV